MLEAFTVLSGISRREAIQWLIKLQETMNAVPTLHKGAIARRRKQPRKNAREDLYRMLNGRNKATKVVCTAPDLQECKYFKLWIWHLDVQCNYLELS